MTDDLELQKVRNQAKMLGISFHHRAGVDKIKGLIADFLLEEREQTTEEAVAQAAELDTAEAVPDGYQRRVPTQEVKPMTATEFKRRQSQEARKNAGRLIRCNIQNMNPTKREWRGEIISVGSAKLGTFKKFIPFNTGVPYHVPKIIFDVMKEKKCSFFYTVNDEQGNPIRKSRLGDEYALEILPDLSPEELSNLAKTQALQAGQA